MRFARMLRQRSTPAEELLWEGLRDRRLFGAKFRRQHPFGPYVLDFFCFAARLAVEADGASHFPQSFHDRLRDDWLRKCGIEVLRFENDEILIDPERVLRAIARVVRKRTPSPPGRGGRG